jgi:adenylyltransferase/sulfurtransferase
MSTKKVLGKNTEKIKNKQVLIVGVGGLGCTVANLLARVGIKLIVVDHDIVDDTNLERQILYDKNDLLKSKVSCVKEKLSQFTEIKSINEELVEKNIQKIISKNIDLVIDCTDNVKTRLLINKYCNKNKINWIYSGAVSNIGAIFFVDNKNNSPCYECLQQNKDGETSCEIGVLNSIVVMIASMTTNIAINYLVNGKIEDKLLRINFNDNTLMKINVKKNVDCKTCSKK